MRQKTMAKCCEGSGLVDLPLFLHRFLPLFFFFIQAIFCESELPLTAQ
jgi:hypothetical protein